MEDIIQVIISIFIVAAVVVAKLIELSRRKMPLPLPEPLPSGELPEDFEIIYKQIPETKKPAITIPVEEPRQIRIRKPVVERVEKPAISVGGFSRNELQNGIILSTILGPPRSISKFKLYRNCLDR